MTMQAEEFKVSISANVHPMVRVYEVLEKAHRPLSAREMATTLENEGYPLKTITQTTTKLSKENVIEPFEGSGTKSDPYKYYLSPGANKPESREYRHKPRRTSTQVKADKYKAEKAAGKIRLSEATKNAINKAARTIPATTNNSLASEIQRLHLGELAVTKKQTKVEKDHEELLKAFGYLEEAGLNPRIGLTLNFNGQELTVNQLRQKHKEVEDEYFKLSKIIQLVKGL